MPVLDTNIHNHYKFTQATSYDIEIIFKVIYRRLFYSYNLVVILLCFSKESSAQYDLENMYVYLAMSDGT